MNETMTISRRSILKSGGALLVSFGAAAILPKHLLAQNPPPGQPAPVLRELDSFLAIHEDGTVTIYTSHVDIGTGINTVYCQIAAEELGIPVERFAVIQGNTSNTPNHGGTGGSSGVPRCGADIRQAAATARKALIDRACEKLQCGSERLTIEEGNVHPIAGGPGISVSALIGGKHFDLKVDPKAPLRDPATYTVVGKPILRPDVAAKATPPERQRIFLYPLQAGGDLRRNSHRRVRGSRCWNGHHSARRVRA
jgi:nicotinate dehydrogenase subunit B